MENCFKPEAGARVGVPKIGILITDGKSQDDVIPPSEMLRNAGIELFAIGKNRREEDLLYFFIYNILFYILSCCVNVHVHCNSSSQMSVVTRYKSRQMCVCTGVKNADENELLSIASEPENTHVYNVADFNIMSSIVEGLTRTVCEQVELQDKDIKESKDEKEEKTLQRPKLLSGIKTFFMPLHGAVLCLW